MRPSSSSYSFQVLSGMLLLALREPASCTCYSRFILVLFMASPQGARMEASRWSRQVSHVWRWSADPVRSSCHSTDQPSAASNPN
jgi:hypothetical protein